MVLTAAALTLLLLFAGLALDFGRAHLLKAQLQTAVDAAALAGALQVIPMVEISIRRYEASETWCKDPLTHVQYPCMDWDPASPVVLTGTQWDLLHLGLWRARAGAQCTWPYRCDSYRIVREWLVLPPSAEPVAEGAFYRNATWPAGALAPTVDRPTVITDSREITVTAVARMQMPTTFLKLIGIREVSFERRGTATPVKR